VVLEYDLMPPEYKNPDIIINAYATNDMHILTVLDAQSGNATLRDKVFDMTQDFVRRVMEPPAPPAHSNCPQQQAQAQSQQLSQYAPLLIHMDDYLGNEQRQIWATTELSQGVQVLANYYGFASASYADVVRDFVYGDTKEYWFSPQGWYNDEGEFAREIHPNMGMHMVASWVMAYNFLNMITNFCSLEGWNLHNTVAAATVEDDKGSFHHRRMDYNSTLLNHLPVLNGRFWPPGKPQAPPRGLPPLLDKQLSLEHVTDLWRLEDDKRRQREQQQDDLSSSTACSDASQQQQQNAVKCPFSWLSGISSETAKPKAADAYFREHASFAGDWTFQDDHGKLGIVPPALMSTMSLELPTVSQPIRKVTLFFMKSYGPRWMGSKVRVECWRKHNNQQQGEQQEGDWKLLQQQEFMGHHNKNTSETYTELIDLSQTPVETGSGLKIRVTLIDGSTFKIMGVAICS